MLSPVLEGVTSKALTSLNKVPYLRCSSGHGEHDLLCVLLSWVWRSVVLCSRSPTQNCSTLSPPFFTRLLFCAVWHQPWS